MNFITGFAIVAVLVGYWGLSDILAAERAVAACEAAVFYPHAYWFCGIAGVVVLPFFGFTRSEAAQYALLAFFVLFHIAAPYASWAWLDRSLETSGVPETERPALFSLESVTFSSATCEPASIGRSPSLTNAA